MKVLNVLTGGKIVAVGDDPGDQRVEWSWMLGNAQGLWLKLEAASSCAAQSDTIVCLTFLGSRDLPVGKGNWDVVNIALCRPSEWVCEIIQQGKSSDAEGS